LQRETDASAEAEPQGGTEPAVSPEGTSPAPEQPAAETPAAEGAPAPAAVVVDDEAETVGPGQMTKSEFFTRLRAATQAAAEEALAGTEHAGRAGPLIDLWLGSYEEQDTERINRDLPRFAGERPRPTTAEDYIGLITERVRASVATWAKTGEITGVPEGLSPSDMELPGMGSLGGGLLGGLGSVFFKAKPGGARAPDHPAAVQARLGAGRPLEGSIRSRMESAFGRSFSHVRVHNDSAAAGLSTGFNARAFTVGSHVAFGPQEYRPGTMIGDALIAHELAHVAQQGDAGAAGPVRAEGAAYQALERDADLATVGAVAAMWTGLRGRLRSFPRPEPRLSSGLRLQRCDRCRRCGGQQAAAPTAPSSALGPVTAPTPQAAPTPPHLKWEPADNRERTGTCGSFSWQTQWSLDRPTTRGGLLVQKIHVDFEHVKDCSDQDVQNDINYWEAWEIKPNKTTTTITEAGHLHDDEFLSGRPVPGTKGRLEYRGSADFYEGQTLPSSFHVDPSSPAQELPMTWNDPHLTGGSGQVDRTLVATWDCCDPSSDRATTLTHP